MGMGMRNVAAFIRWHARACIRPTTPRSGLECNYTRVVGRCASRLGERSIQSACAPGTGRAAPPALLPSAPGPRERGGRRTCSGRRPPPRPAQTQTHLPPVCAKRRQWHGVPAASQMVTQMAAGCASADMRAQLQALPEARLLPNAHSTYSEQGAFILVGRLHSSSAGTMLLTCGSDQVKSQSWVWQGADAVGASSLRKVQAPIFPSKAAASKPAEACLFL